MNNRTRNRIRQQQSQPESHPAAATQPTEPNQPGPKTPEGKQRSRMNAVRHGLTGKLLVIEAGQQTLYDTLSRDFHLRYQPADAVERNLLQIVIDTVWRLNGCFAIENNLFAAGTISYTADTQHDSEIEAAFSRGTCWLNFGTHFDKLGRYETRLQRQLARSIELLESLQSKRPAVSATAEAEAAIPAALVDTGLPVCQPPSHSAAVSQAAQNEAVTIEEDSFRKMDERDPVASEPVASEPQSELDESKPVPAVLAEIYAEMARELAEIDAEIERELAEEERLEARKQTRAA